MQPAGFGLSNWKLDASTGLYLLQYASSFVRNGLKDAQGHEATTDGSAVLGLMHSGLQCSVRESTIISK